MIHNMLEQGDVRRSQAANSQGVFTLWALKLIKRGPEYGHLTKAFSGVSDAIDEALVTLEYVGYIALPAVCQQTTSHQMQSRTSKIAEFLNTWHYC